MDRHRKITWVFNTKIDISVVLFVEFRLFFFDKISFSYWSFHNYPILGKIGESCRGHSCSWGRHCSPFQNEKWLCLMWVLLSGLGLLMVSSVGYRVCGYFLYVRTPIYVPSSWIIQIASPLQGTNSFTYLGKGIRCLPQFEPCSSSQKGKVHIVCSYLFSKL